MDTVTARAAFDRAARDAPPGARVPVEVRITVSDPFLAYRRARPGPDADADTDADSPAATAVTGAGHDGSGCCYLETTGGQPGWGYFGVDPVDRLTVWPDDGSALDALGELLDGETLVRGDCSIPYPCGAVGWLSYDIARELEGLPDSAVRDRDLPRLQLCVYDRLAAWHSTEPETLRIAACPRIADPADRADRQRAYERGRERAAELAQAIAEGDPTVDDGVATDRVAFESDCTPAEFAERVSRIKDAIRDGDTFQTNVSQRLRAPAAVHPVEAFDALRSVNPAPYSALVEFPGVDLVSASPELLLEREGDRVVTEPIAGTRPRGSTPDEDDRLERELLADEKERAEHAMLVDLERNDLGKVSAYGSVGVTEYRRVDRYSEVMHLVSRVEGRLRSDAGLGDAVAAVFPGGTITGAPKPRTMELIDEVERTRRGPYTGSLGVFGFDDRATLSILIRTLVRYRGEYYLRVGAGIVHDSVPDREYAETLDKGRALVTAVDEALGERAQFTVDH